jgi:hypothetical protein
MPKESIISELILLSREWLNHFIIETRRTINSESTSAYLRPIAEIERFDSDTLLVRYKALFPISENDPNFYYDQVILLSYDDIISYSWENFIDWNTCDWKEPSMSYFCFKKGRYTDGTWMLSAVRMH